MSRSLVRDLPSDNLDLSKYWQVELSVKGTEVLTLSHSHGNRYTSKVRGSRCFRWTLMYVGRIGAGRGVGLVKLGAS